VRWYRRGDLDLEPAQDPPFRSERVRELVDALPEAQMLAVSLMYFGGGSPTLDTVAREMGVSVHTVKSLLAKGVTALGEALQEEDGVGPL
jgi:DNA-directed RNA polymerase specialized sigma24 family protein